jgi:ABC-type transporter Mla subunit MlaD
MPSVSERQRNNVKAGVFVSIALILALVVVVVLTDALEKLTQSRNSYTVVFDVASGIPNIKRGSEVRVGGVTMGRVTRIDPRLAPGTRTLSVIAVEFELDQIAQLYTDAQIFVAAPLIGSEGWLDIPSVGTSGQPATGEIAGQSSAGFLTSLLGGENKSKANEIMDNALQFSEFLAAVPQEYQTRVVPVIDDVKATSGDVRAVTHDFRAQRWPAWADAVNSVMTWANELPQRINSALDEGKGMFTDVRGVIGENREDARAIVSKVKQTTETLNSETIDKVHQLLDTGQQGLDSAVATLKDVQNDYDGWATEIGETLGDATIASQQLKLAMIEVRRSPWRVLYRPTADEVEHEHLYNAARSFAVAAADLKAAAASVQRVIDSNEADVLRDSESFRRLQQSLVDSLEQYEQTQQRLLDVIIANPVEP